MWRWYRIGCYTWWQVRVYADLVSSWRPIAGLLKGLIPFISCVCRSQELVSFRPIFVFSYWAPKGVLEKGRADSWEYVYIYIYIVTFFRRWSMILFLWFEQKNCIAVGNSTFHMNIPSQDLSDLYADGGWATMVSGREVHSWEPVYFRTWSGSITPTPWSLQDKASAEVSGVGPSQRWVRRPGLDDLGSEHSASQNESHVHRLLKLLILATILPWKITTGIVLLSYCSFVL